MQARRGWRRSARPPSSGSYHGRSAFGSVSVWVLPASLTLAQAGGYPAAPAQDPPGGSSTTPPGFFQASSPSSRRGENDEADLSAEPDSAKARARLPQAHAERRGPERSEATAGEGPQADRSLDAVEVVVSLRTGRFQHADRLRRFSEFRRVTRRGRRAAGGAFVVLVSERPDPAPELARCRLGITVSRKVGGAVVRNRVKRRIREWFRARRGSLGVGVDWVVIARAPAAGLAREAAEDELSRLSRAVLCSVPQEGTT